MKSILPIVFILFFYAYSFAQVCPTGSSEPTILLAGDSWAEYMWSDGRYNPVLDKFGFADKDAIGNPLGSSPNPGYTGPAYTVSGSLARDWADKANFPYINNVIDEITANPTIKTVVLSIGGNDMLAGRPEGGWYQNMDQDVPGAEAALLDELKNNTMVIINDIQAVHPDVEFLISSYDFVNFSIPGFACLFYACQKRRDLSYDNNNLITDAELNQMMITIETFRINEIVSVPGVYFDNAIGLMHYYYGDGTNAPGTLPYPEQTTPYSATFYGGNPSLPALRSNFRNGFDPIHLDEDGYEYKIINQTKTHFIPQFRANPDITIFSNGGNEDGWSNGVNSNTNGVRVGNNTNRSYSGILSFDTSLIPDGSTVDKVSLFLVRSGLSNANPFSDQAVFGAPILEVKKGSFGQIEIENNDATTPADAVDAGCFHGSVSGNNYALRIDLNASGLAAINTSGTTQFRISFPNASGTSDFVTFNDGDAVLDTDITTESLEEYMEDARPFLDIKYTPPVQLAAKVMLQGPYLSSTGLMATNLNDNGLIPLMEPYSALGMHVGSEETSATVLAAHPVVDWVLVELRDKTNAATMVETKAGLLMTDGSIMAEDGVSDLTFSSTPDSYYVAVRHRNHLGVMTLNPTVLTEDSVLDFTTSALFGTDAAEASTGTQFLWAGDALADGELNAADRSECWNNRNDITYLLSDCDLSGSTDAADRSITWNNRNKMEQLP